MQKDGGILFSKVIFCGMIFRYENSNGKDAV